MQNMFHCFHCQISFIILKQRIYKIINIRNRIGKIKLVIDYDVPVESVSPLDPREITDLTMTGYNRIYCTFSLPYKSNVY